MKNNNNNCGCKEDILGNDGVVPGLQSSDGFISKLKFV